MPRWSVIAMQENPMKQYLKETRLLDYSHPSIQHLLAEHNWTALEPFERTKAIYLYTRDKVLFGYNAHDEISASLVLSDGYGQCNTKGILLMALLRGCGIPCRIHGFLIDKKLQKGAMPGIVYRHAPREILHSWVEVYLEGVWYDLEGVILDQAYLEKLQARYPNCTGIFCGYGVAVKDFRNPVIDFERNNTYIQREGIVRDLGIYDEPDDLLQAHGQNLGPCKGFLYRNFGRHWMNRNIHKIRK